jgi:DNA-binding CsgD family transcriptional regulator
MVAGISRFRLLQTIQTIVLRGLGTERGDAFRRRHAAHFLDAANEWDRVAAEGGAGDLVARFDADADNVRRALDYLETADPLAGLSLLSRLGSFWASRGRFTEGYERLRRARANAREPSPELARAAAGQLGAIWPLMSPNDIRDLIDWTIETARAVGETGALAEALRQRAHHAFNEEDVSGLLAAAAELEAISSDLDTLGRVNRADIRALAAAATEGRTSDRHVELVRAYLGDLESAGLSMRHAFAEGNLAGSLLGRGEYEEAIQRAQHAAGVLRDLGQADEVAWALAFVGPALAEAGRTDEAVEAALECATISAEVGYPEHISSALWSAIPVALAVDQPELAARLWGAVVRGMHARGDVVLNPLDADLADAWLKRARRAAPGVSVELAIREGEADDPTALLRSLPRLLQAPGRQVTPVGVLRHGMLTKREIEVLTLVGKGRSDPEIADALFISAKTASVHVTNIKGKLGVDSRLQVALRARELGLVKGPAQD